MTDIELGKYLDLIQELSKVVRTGEVEKRIVEKYCIDHDTIPRLLFDRLNPRIWEVEHLNDEEISKSKDLWEERTGDELDRLPRLYELHFPGFFPKHGPYIEGIEYARKSSKNDRGYKEFMLWMWKNIKYEAPSEWTDECWELDMEIWNRAKKEHPKYFKRLEEDCKSFYVKAGYAALDEECKKINEEFKNRISELKKANVATYLIVKKRKIEII